MNQTEALSFRREQQNGTKHYYLQGRLDTSTTPLLEEELAAVIEKTDCLILDFMELEYVSSSGLRLLLTLHGM